ERIWQPQGWGLQHEETWDEAKIETMAAEGLDGYLEAAYFSSHDSTGKPFAGSGATFSDEARRNGREDMLHFVEANQALLRAARAKRSRGLVLRTGTS